MVLGMERKWNECSITVFSWGTTVGLIVQETIQGALDKYKFIQALLVFGESSVCHGKSLELFLGLVWVLLGSNGSYGEVGESHLFRPGVLSLSCWDDLNSWGREGHLNVRYSVGHLARFSLCRGHTDPSVLRARHLSATELPSLIAASYFILINNPGRWFFFWFYIRKNWGSRDMKHCMTKIIQKRMERVRFDHRLSYCQIRTLSVFHFLCMKDTV